MADPQLASLAPPAPTSVAPRPSFASCNFESNASEMPEYASRAQWGWPRASASLTLALLIVIVAIQPVHAQTERLLYSFKGTNGDGARTYARLIMDSKGNLYGTTSNGGSSTCFCGTVFRLDTSGHETVLYTFTNLNGDGDAPEAGLIIDTSGNLYGTTVQGGTYGSGTVFKLDTTGHETVLYSFSNSNGDGAIPGGSLIMDTAGNLYGPTGYGGSYGMGTVFKLDTTGHETVLHSFGSNGDGTHPASDLVMDAAGNLYGSTFQGGAFTAGTVFKIDTSGNETVLHSFGGSDGDGVGGSGGLVMDNTGNLYGTTQDVRSAQGASCCGTLFKLDSSGHETILYTLTNASNEGEFPNGDLVLDKNGNLYGTTYKGGASGVGTVFKLDGSNQYIVLHSFATSADGAYPDAGLIMKNGNLYGTTFGGGTSTHCSFSSTTGCGTVFKITLPNFKIVASPTSATVSPGRSTTSTLTLTSLAGFNGTVALTCAVPGGHGLGCGVSPSSVILSSSNSATATLSVDTSTTTPPGTYKIRETGTSGRLVQSTTFTLTVQ